MPQGGLAASSPHDRAAGVAHRAGSAHRFDGLSFSALSPAGSASNITSPTNPMSATAVSPSPSPVYHKGSVSAARPDSPNVLLRRAFEKAFQRPAPPGVRVDDSWDDLNPRRAPSPHSSPSRSPLRARRMQEPQSRYPATLDSVPLRTAKQPESQRRPVLDHAINTHPAHTAYPHTAHHPHSPYPDSSALEERHTTNGVHGCESKVHYPTTRLVDRFADPHHHVHHDAESHAKSSTPDELPIKPPSSACTAHRGADLLFVGGCMVIMAEGSEVPGTAIIDPASLQVWGPDKVVVSGADIIEALITSDGLVSVRGQDPDADLLLQFPVRLVQGFEDGLRLLQQRINEIGGKFRIRCLTSPNAGSKLLRFLNMSAMEDQSLQDKSTSSLIFTSHAGEGSMSPETVRVVEQGDGGSSGRRRKKKESKGSDGYLEEALQQLVHALQAPERDIALLSERLSQAKDALLRRDSGARGRDEEGGRITHGDMRYTPLSSYSPTPEHQPQRLNPVIEHTIENAVDSLLVNLGVHATDPTSYLAHFLAVLSTRLSQRDPSAPAVVLQELQAYLRSRTPQDTFPLTPPIHSLDRSMANGHSSSKTTLQAHFGKIRMTRAPGGGLQYVEEGDTIKGPTWKVVYDGIGQLWMPDISENLSLPTQDRNLVLAQVRYLAESAGVMHNIPRPSEIEVGPVVVTVPRQPGEPLGLNTEPGTLKLSSAENENTPAARIALGRKMPGFQITHVLGHPVNNMMEVNSVLESAPEATEVMLRLKRPPCVVCGRDNCEGELRKSGYKCKRCVGKKGKKKEKPSPEVVPSTDP